MSSEMIGAAPSAADTTPANRLTFTCCVEYGTLEEGTIRFAESLRKFGGEFADCQVIAVTPRRGAPLRPETLKRFRELGVQYLKIAPPNRYSWMSYVNKYFALREAEKHARGDLMVWMDSDVIVLGPPTELLLAPDEDFAACQRDKNIGSRGPDDEWEKYWNKVCSDVGLKTDDLPWVETTADHERIRLYWNAGIFVYRPSAKLLDAWYDAMDKVLDKTDSSNLNDLFWTDQVCLSLVAVLKKLRFRHLNGALNYGIATHFKDHLTPDGLRTAKLLHYHDSMKAANWTWFLDQMGEPQPQVRGWLETLGPVAEPTNFGGKVIRDAYKAVRQVRRRIWSRSHGAEGLGY